MPDPRRQRSPGHGPAVRSLMVRLDDESKECLSRAARLRGLSLSDYVRAVTIPQARRELLAARAQTLALTAEEQLAFWNALAEPPPLTGTQRRLGSLMRGDS